MDEALRQRVDGVLLVGDVVEQKNDFYEAFADLLQGVERLADSGVTVIGVAGNHDVDVLPKLADVLPSFRLLGREGVWQTTTVKGADGVSVRVAGWSFPRETVQSSPLLGEFPQEDSQPMIGLLHCDRDQTGSRYAPVRSSELENAPVDAWLLGHIHKPDSLSVPRPNGYLGSLTGMDPGEPGARGPWLLEVGARGVQAIEQIPLAPLRWEDVAVPIDDLEKADDINGLVIAALGELHDRIESVPYQPRAVGCRLHFIGRSDLRLDIEQQLRADDPRLSPYTRGDIVYFVHDWRLQALPAVDLAEIARGTDPVGLIARKLNLLHGGPSPERAALIHAARQSFADAVNHRNFAPLAASPPNDEQTAAIVEASALEILDELLAQRDATT